MTRINGLELHTETLGTGIPFIWAHGLMLSMAGEDRAPFGINWQEIAKQARLVRYDARGHGLSQASYSPQDYHWSNLAQDMLALADQQGFDRFIAGGQSMGCATSVYAALSAPDRVGALVLMNPPTAWETRSAQGALYDQMAALIETAGVDRLISILEQQSVLPAWQTQAFPDLGQDYLRSLHSFDPQALIQILRGAKLANLPERESLRALTMPALILAWADDPTHPLSSAEEFARLLPNSRLLIARSTDDVAVWTQAIADFIAQVPAAHQNQST